jgi:hypothetical protein
MQIPSSQLVVDELLGGFAVLGQPNANPRRQSLNRRFGKC